MPRRAPPPPPAADAPSAEERALAIYSTVIECMSKLLTECQSLGTTSKALNEMHGNILLVLAAIKTENDCLREETAFLRDKVDQLWLQLTESSAAGTPPPSPGVDMASFMDDMQL
jgi:hypothetical protein